ncbi:MAG: glycosyltransferase family 2 protein [Microcoleaceae cyanobacterium]
MNSPRLSIIIPTYNRQDLLAKAVESALAQTIEDFEVIVVDDASPQPVNLPKHPRLQVIRLPENKGPSTARNMGVKAANGRWVTFLDDDDRLLPHTAQVVLDALENTTLPQPVALLSALEVINDKGEVKKVRIPPTLPKGCHFGLEEIEPNQSFFCKQSMVVEKEVLLSIGGFDELFTCRETTELFLRLNQVCSIQGIPTVTYQFIQHQTRRISHDTSRRQANVNRLLKKHQSLFKAHPKMFASFIYDHAIKLCDSGQIFEGIKNLLKAVLIHPTYTLVRIVSSVKNNVIRL